MTRPYYQLMVKWQHSSIHKYLKITIRYTKTIS
jgi:hypothetical protein